MKTTTTTTINYTMDASIDFNTNFNNEMLAVDIVKLYTVATCTSKAEINLQLKTICIEYDATYAHMHDSVSQLISTLGRVITFKR